MKPLFLLPHLGPSFSPPGRRRCPVFVSDFSLHRSAALHSRKLRDMVRENLSVRPSRQVREDMVAVSDALVAVVDQLGRIEATAAEPPHVLEGMVVVQLELGPGQLDRLPKLRASLDKLERWAKGEALVNLGVAKRLVDHLLELAAEAEHRGGAK